MFTGIIREVGTLRAATRTGGGARLTIEAPRAAEVLVEGGSIAVDGTCLTATSISGGCFTADAVAETLARTICDEYRTGARVNLEHPLSVGDPLDGHIVQGHVDGTGVVSRITDAGIQRTVSFEVAREVAPFLAVKGSVAVNGVSLTVTNAGVTNFSVALIPTTLRETNLGDASVGTRVNLEVDVLARYVARLAESGGGRGLTREKLKGLGF